MRPSEAVLERLAFTTRQATLELQVGADWQDVLSFDTAESGSVQLSFFMRALAGSPKARVLAGTDGEHWVPITTIDEAGEDRSETLAPDSTGIHCQVTVAQLNGALSAFRHFKVQARALTAAATIKVDGVCK